MYPESLAQNFRGHIKIIGFRSVGLSVYNKIFSFCFDIKIQNKIFSHYFYGLVVFLKYYK